MKTTTNGKFTLRSDGTVWRTSKRRSRIVKQSIGSHGYKQVWFNNEVCLVHRLLAESFIPNPKKLQQVDHKNRNKLNNDLNNLEWVTPKENSRRANNIKVLWNGKTFNSLKELSSFVGLAPNTVSESIKKGRLIKGYVAIKI